MSTTEKRQLIVTSHPRLSLKKQCELLDVSRRACHIFNNLNPTITKSGPSYNDYYIIFYAITGYHLAAQLEEKNLFKAQYIKYVEVAKFTFFDLEFLETYFDE